MTARQWTGEEIDIDPEVAAEEAATIVAGCRTVLADHHPAAQGGALAELAAMFFAGHRPELREDLLAIHFKTVRDLIEPCEREIFEQRKRPEDWPPIRSWSTR